MKRILSLLLISSLAFCGCGRNYAGNAVTEDRTGTATGSGMTEITSESVPETRTGMAEGIGKSGLKKGSIVLFAGDSITDMGRMNHDSPRSLGYKWNYVNRFNDYLQEHFPEDNITVYNEGFSGFTIVQFAAKVKECVIDLKPDYLVLELGTNNAWNETGKPVSVVRDDYRRLLDTIEAETDAEIILVQPFLFDSDEKFGSYSIGSYVGRMNEICDAICRLAADRGYSVFFFREIFAQCMEKYGMAYHDFSDDCIHPNAKGYEILTDVMLSEMGITEYKTVYSFDFDEIRGHYGIVKFGG